MWHPSVCNCPVLTPAPKQVCFCSGFVGLVVLELMWNSVAVGSWWFCFSQKECTASCLQRAFSIKGSWLFMTSSLGYSLCAGVVGAQISSRSDKMHKPACPFRVLCWKEWHGVPGWLPGGEWKTAGALCCWKLCPCPGLYSNPGTPGEPSLYPWAGLLVFQ